MFENVIHSFENTFSKSFENSLRTCLERGKIPDDYSKPNLVNWETNQSSCEEQGVSDKINKIKFSYVRS